ncbi:MAG: choice-of-anchor Q domain-containing protein, partial [Pseudomonadota bacterium]
DTLTDEGVDNASCSLREAIVASNDDAPYLGCDAGSGADIIRFSVQGTIVLVEGLPFVRESFELSGPGAENLTIDGDGQYRLFDVEELDANGRFVFSGVTLTRGLANAGPAISIQSGQTVEVRDAVLIDNISSNGAGAISANGNPGQPVSLTIERVALINNEAQGPSSGGAVRAGNSEVTVIVTDSLFQNNRASHENGSGGGMLLFGVSDTVTATIHNTTFSGNQASDSGGGLRLSSQATATITDSTFTANTANADDDGGDSGGGIGAGSGEVNITNTVVAGNFVGAGGTSPDVINNAFVSGGFNFIGDNTFTTGPFPEGNPNVNGDYVGTSSNPLDPGLLPLMDNGGFTASHLPDATSSPLIDAGSCAGARTDQRGFGNATTGTRIVDDAGFTNADDGCDLGAVEAFSVFIATPFIFADGFETVTN